METETKQSFYQAMEIQLKEWGIHLDEMSSKAGTEYSRTVQALKESLEVLRKKLGEMKEAKGPAWEALKVGLDKSWSELKRGLDEAYRKLK